MVNTLIPPTGGSDVARGIQKKPIIMKKEYLRPEAFIVPMTTQGMMMSMSSTGVDDNESNDPDNWGVKEETTNGGTIWDNEW